MLERGCLHGQSLFLSSENYFNSMKIGITGGIGAGKSTVARVFQALGVPLYDADSAAKRLMQQHTALKAAISEAFGAESYTLEGQLNRAYLAQRVFPDPAALEMLNGLVHPKVAEDYAQWDADQHAQGAPYTLKEAALLFETGSHRQLDAVVLVTAPDALRLARVLQRDPQRDRTQVEAIMAQQMPEAEKQQHTQWKIVNDEEQLVIPQVLALHKRFLAMQA